MISWLEATIVAASAAILLAILCLLIRKHLASKKTKQVAAEAPTTRSSATDWGNRGMKADGLQPALREKKLDHRPSLHHPIELGVKRKQSHSVFRRGSSTKPPLFNWSDHPALITDAIENGWSRFGFTVSTPPPSSIRSSIMGIRAAAGDHAREAHSEISWEVGEGSVDFMQKIRFNSGLKTKIAGGNSTCVARTALPLPGPPSSFPQEAYFEMKIVSRCEEEKLKVSEGEKTKLIQERDSSDKRGNRAPSLAHVTSSHGCRGLEELKLGSRGGGGGGGGKDQAREAMVSLGLTTGGCLPHRIPGSYPGSIGFNSNGSVSIDGIKLIFETDKEGWGQVDRVIGCGFHPRQRKVFFTVDSKLVHMVHCKSEPFETPLYPVVVAANTDLTVLINFGQSSFRYEAANAHRTPNPCFTLPPRSNSSPQDAALGYEVDSRELFSMGRIDSGWLNYCGATKSSSTGNTYYYNDGRGGLEYDEEESEADLFEIVLDEVVSSPLKV